MNESVRARRQIDFAHSQVIISPLKSPAMEEKENDEGERERDRRGKKDL